MSAIPSFPCSDLWGERSLRVEVVHYPLHRADEALDDLRAGRFAGAAVLDVGRPGPRP